MSSDCLLYVNSPSLTFLQCDSGERDYEYNEEERVFTEYENDPDRGTKNELEERYEVKFDRGVLVLGGEKGEKRFLRKRDDGGMMDDEDDSDKDDSLRNLKDED